MLLNRPAILFGNLTAIFCATRVNGSRRSRFMSSGVEGRSAQFFEEISSRSLIEKRKCWLVRDRCGKRCHQDAATYLLVRIVPSGSCHLISGDRPRTRGAPLHYTWDIERPHRLEMSTRTRNLIDRASSGARFNYIYTPPQQV